MTDLEIDTSDPTALVELVRWHVVASLRFASSWSPEVGLACVRHVSAAAGFDEHAHSMMRDLSLRGARLQGSGAIPFLELLKLFGHVDWPEMDGMVPLLVPPGNERFVETLLPSPRMSLEQVQDLVQWSVLAFAVFYATPGELADWEGRLASGDGDLLETYSALSFCLLTGAAFAREVVPPWLRDREDDLHLRLVRAAWKGRDAYEQLREELFGSDAVKFASVDLTPELVGRLDAEARRRGLGGAFMALAPDDQGTVLSAVLSPGEDAS